MAKVDLIIIGAGIHGVAAAREAAQQGLSVRIIERREAAGLETSSASTKLIHGGLRYLETGEFHLVYECLQERRWLVKHYPDLVRLRSFVLPVYRHSRRGPWVIFLGLLCYWLLSGCGGRFPWPIAKQRCSEWGLKASDLITAFTYLDAQTDDCLLTQTVLREAQSLGAELVLNASIDSIEHRDGYRVHLQSGEQFHARALLNAAGPWVNHVADSIHGSTVPPKAQCSWVQGSHIVLHKPISDRYIFCESPEDGRAVFILPWQDRTMVGTTESVRSNPKAIASEAEIQYLLNVVNYYFPDAVVDTSHVEKSFAGVRVLPGAPLAGQAVNKSSRETVFVSHPQPHADYVAIYGGKLTSHRVTAKKALARLTVLARP